MIIALIMAMLLQPSVPGVYQVPYDSTQVNQGSLQNGSLSVAPPGTGGSVSVAPSAPYSGSVSVAPSSPSSGSVSILGDAGQKNTTPVTTAPAAPVQTTVATTYADNSADIATQQAAIAALKAGIAPGLARNQTALDNVLGQYNNESTSFNNAYTANENTAKTNLQANTSEAELNAARGRQGLFGILQSLGALNGSGITLANNAVQNGANADLGKAQDAYAGDMNTLNETRDKFKTENSNAEDLARNQKLQADSSFNYNNLTGQQNALKSIMGDYAAEGPAHNADRDNYSRMAQALFPQIQHNLNTAPIPITYQATPYTMPTLSRYVGGTSGNGTSVVSTPATNTDNPIPGLSAVPSLRKLATA